MNTRDLEYILAVAETGNFTEAAKRCNVSQPTLSMQIKKCEEWLDVQVFERSNKKVLITPAGQEILKAMRRVHDDMRHLKEVAISVRDPLAGLFRLGAFPTIASYVLPDYVAKIAQHFPKLTLWLSEEKTDILIAQLKDGTLDAALIALPVHEEELQSVALFDDPFLLAVPAGHILAKRKTISMNDLDGLALLLLEEGHCLREQALEVCTLHHVTTRQDFRATSLETLRMMVKAGSGITLMPALACPKDLKEEGICYIKFTRPPTRHIGLVWRKISGRQPLMEKLVGVLKG